VEDCKVYYGSLITAVCCKKVDLFVFIYVFRSLVHVYMRFVQTVHLTVSLRIKSLMPPCKSIFTNKVLIKSAPKCEMGAQ